MKTILTLTFLVAAFPLQASMTPQEKQGLQNIIVWSTDLKSQLDTAQLSVKALNDDNMAKVNQIRFLTNEVASLTTKVAFVTEQKDESDKERDSLVWIFSLACGMAALSGAYPLLKALDGLWKIGALIGVFVAGFSVGFSIGRFTLHFLAQFTPHLPF